MFPVAAVEERSDPTLPSLGFLPRPMGILDVLDAGFALLRREFVTVMAGAAIFVLPVATITVLDTGIAARGDDPYRRAAAFGLDLGWQVEGALALLRSLAVALLGVFVALLVRSRLGGEHAGLLRLLRGVLSRSGRLMRAWALHVLLLAIALPTVVAIPLVMAATLSISPVVGFEPKVSAGPFGLRGRGAVGRSFDLTKRRLPATMVIVLVSSGVTLLTSWLPVGAVGLLQLVEIGFRLPDVVHWTFAVVVGALANTAAGAVSACVACTAYVDLRCRTEGWDLLSRMTREMA